MNIKLETLPHASSYLFTLEGLLEISKITELEMEFKPETVPVSLTTAEWPGRVGPRAVGQGWYMDSV